MDDAQVGWACQYCGYVSSAFICSLTKDLSVQAWNVDLIVLGRHDSCAERIDVLSVLRLQQKSLGCGGRIRYLCVIHYQTRVSKHESWTTKTTTNICHLRVEQALHSKLSPPTPDNTRASFFRPQLILTIDYSPASPPPTIITPTAVAFITDMTAHPS